MLLSLLLAGITFGGTADEGKTPATTGAKVQPALSSRPDKQSSSTNFTENPLINREWKMEELLPVIANLGSGRDFEQGKKVFDEAMCGKCHALGRISQGNGLAPDLTGVGSKYTRDIILESILQPSVVISGQFYTTNFKLKNGGVEQGTLLDIVDGKYVIAPSQLSPENTITVLEADIASEEPSTVSPMPEGLLNAFTKEQIQNLFAFLDAQGNPKASIFKKTNPTKK